MRKNRTAAILTALLLLSAQAAQANGLGITSQFGFTGWPGMATVCPTGVPTCTPEKSSQSTLIPTQCVEHVPEMSPSPTNRPPEPTQVSSAPTQGTAVQIPPTAAPTATRTPSTGHDYTTVSISAQEQNAINLLNSDRQAKNLAALTPDPELCRLARLKSEDMRDRHYFAHESPTYGKAADMLKQFGYSFSAVGENIAHHATVEKAEAAFLSSEGHRRNLLGASWTKMGVGVCFDSDGYVYVTQLFVR